MYNILICDDEQDIVSALQIYLDTGEYNIYTAFNGREALSCVEKNEIHLILMDVMMPVMDGIAATVAIRKNHNMPIIMLTAKSEDTDKILGLNIGADDYVTKPFNPVEVLARVRSQLRRYIRLGGNSHKEERKPDVITCGDVSIHDKRKEFCVNGQPISLTPTEFEIVKLLMEHPDEVVSPRDIYRRVWHDDPYGAENTVAVHIRHIREKIEIDAKNPRYLKVVWGKGYKMEGGGR